MDGGETFALWEPFRMFDMAGGRKDFMETDNKLCNFHNQGHNIYYSYFFIEASLDI